MLAVIAYHAGLPLPGGFIGVDVFFVISGFVITLMVLPELGRTETLSLTRFYSRRILRLGPALAVMLVVVALASALLLNPLETQKSTAKTGIASSLFAANIELFKAPAGYFDAPAEANPLLHTWSLAVEEQFYLVFPLLLVVTWVAAVRRKWSRRRMTAVVIGVASALSFGVSLYMSQRNPKFAFYASPIRAWEFGAGALLAILAVKVDNLGHAVKWLLGAVGLALVGASTIVFNSATPWPGTAALVPIVGTVLLLAAGGDREDGWSRLLGASPFVWIGDLSYSLYLWHWPLIVFARSLWPQSPAWVLVAAAVVSVIPAWLSARFVEARFRSNSQRMGGRVLPVAATAILVPLFAYVGLWQFSAALLKVDPFKNVASQAQPHFDLTKGCALTAPMGARLDPACTWTVPDQRGSVVLIGDSNAGQFAEPVVEAAAAQHLGVTLVTNGGCPFAEVNVQKEDPAFNSTQCRKYVNDSIEHLIQHPPSLVIVASAGTSYVGSDKVRFGKPPDGPLQSSEADKSALWRDGVQSVIGRLTSAGIPVLVINTVPHFPAFDLHQCSTLRILSNGCSPSLTRAEVEKQQDATREAERAAVSTSSQAAAVDFTDELCSADSCTTQRDGQWIYRDGSHLSVSGAMQLKARFSELIRTHAQVG